MGDHGGGNTKGVARGWRLLNRDGTFNIVRKGLHTLGDDEADIYHTLLSISWPQFIGLVIAVYFSVNLLFAAGYHLCKVLGFGGLDGAQGFEDAFFFSVQTLATIGYGKITPTGLLPNLLVTFEALVGLMGLALATGLLFARFSRPTARVVFSNQATIVTHDGVPSLLFRMANARRNQIVEAVVTVSLSISETTAEGERYRSFYELDLERKKSPLFAASWTVVHPICETSPLYGKTQASLADGGAEILVTLTGIDDTFSSTIYTRFSYTPAEIVWDRNFEDILTPTDDGRVIMELERFHQFKAPV